MRNTCVDFSKCLCVSEQLNFLGCPVEGPAFYRFLGVVRLFASITTALQDETTEVKLGFNLLIG